MKTQEYSKQGEISLQTGSEDIHSDKNINMSLRFLIYKQLKTVLE
jgi:hypothetical protein